MGQGLNTAYTGVERSQAYPKLAKVNRDRGKTLMTDRVKVVELFLPMQNSHCHGTTADAYNYLNHNAYVLQPCNFNQSIETFGKWINHSRDQ